MNGIIGYVYSADLIAAIDKFPKIPLRASMVHSLIDAYGLLDKLSLIIPHKATFDELEKFHCRKYLDCLQKNSSADRDDDCVNSEDEEFGLLYDCFAFPDMFDICAWSAGGSLDAAIFLISGSGQVALNWCGGWHHAKRSEASGFCYINDVVLAILKLREHFDRVLYIDLDLHHGDGVQDAFSSSNKVMTVSFHKYSTGFFPCTGAVTDVGIGKGKYFTVNVPLKNGVDDNLFARIFDDVIDCVQTVFAPLAIVCQCGADGLVGDPMMSFNLTPRVFGFCIQKLIQVNKPLLLLGGGGYLNANVARCWTYITAQILGVALPESIPDHEFYLLYGSPYELSLKAGNRINENSDSDIIILLQSIKENLAHINNN